jgi:outer membrane protein TolC
MKPFPRQRTRLLLTLFLLPMSTRAASSPTLDEYVREGLKNNIVLAQKQISLEKAVNALHSATTLFLPSIALQGSYTSGSGGRSIDIPVGDLVNPVYRTLNQLTGSNAFPQIENVKEDFFPDRFYDVRLRTSMPVLNTDLIFNRQIKSSETRLQQWEVELYRRELVKEIKVAYYSYLSAIEAAAIYASATELAREAKRVNESLLKNGSGLPVYVLRAESELQGAEASLVDAEAQADNARRYFNFLLNRDLAAAVTVDSAETIGVEPEAGSGDIARREELSMLSEGVEINKSVLAMKRSYWIPRVSGFLDLGAQDSRWRYSKDSRYTLFGLQLEIPIFEGFRNRNAIDNAELDLKNAELELQRTREGLSLAVTAARNDVRCALRNYESSLKQEAAAAGYHALITRGYREGAHTFIETVDARNQLTGARLLARINRYKVFIARARYEREIAAMISIPSEGPSS